jgi:hypothetical protein
MNFQGTLSSTSSKSLNHHRTKANQSKNFVVSDSSKTTVTIINDATVGMTPNNENMVVKGKHRLAEEVNSFVCVIEINILD